MSSFRSFVVVLFALCSVVGAEINVSGNPGKLVDILNGNVTADSQGYLGEPNYIAKYAGFPYNSSAALLGNFIVFTSPSLYTVALSTGDYYTPNLYIQSSSKEVNGNYWVSVISEPYASNRHISLMLINGDFQIVREYAYLPPIYEPQEYTLPVVAIGENNVIAQAFMGINILQIINGQVSEMTLTNEDFYFWETVARGTGGYATVINSNASGGYYMEFSDVTSPVALFRLPESLGYSSLLTTSTGEPLLFGKTSSQMIISSVQNNSGTLQISTHSYQSQADGNPETFMVSCGGTLTLIDGDYMVNMSESFEPLWAKGFVFRNGTGYVTFTSTLCQDDQSLILNLALSGDLLLIKLDLNGNFTFGAEGDMLQIVDSSLPTFEHTQDAISVQQTSGDGFLTTNSVDSVIQTESNGSLSFARANGGLQYADDI
mmetsp:Transcript_19883/g.22519  ORF Transcript_19883/g.22519 Transcript_19883/m.22519 type:complete len:431 (+) Transcript_19883:63-1355(+)